MLPKTSSGRWLAGIAGAILLLIAVSVTVTLLAGGEADTLPEGSPERTVQDYLLAIEERSYGTAYDLLAPGPQANCSLEDFERATTNMTYNQSGMRIRLDSVDMLESGRAEVAIRVTRYLEARPFPSEDTFTQRYLLEEVEGEWKLADAQGRFVQYACFRGDLVPREPSAATLLIPAPRAEA